MSKIISIAKLLGIIAFALGLGPLSAFAQEPAVVRTSIEPPDDILVGQRVVFRLDVLSTGGWASLPQLPRLDMPGAIVYSPQSQGIRLNETIDGESFSGQRYELWIYPQRPGEITIPSVGVNVSIRTFGSSSDATIKQLQTKALAFHADIPLGVTDATNLICTADLTVQQTWRPENDTAQVGDGVERVITRTVADAPGMVLAPANHADIPGIRLYPKQPQVDDSINRGTLTGRRTDSVVYVFEKPGEYRLPALRSAWWDVDSNELKEALLPGLVVNVRPNADAMQDDQTVVTNSPAHRSPLPWTIFVLVVVMSGLGWHYRAAIQVTLRRLIDSYREREFSKFWRFVRAARAHQPKTTHRALMQWLDHIDTRNPPARLDRFLETYGDAAIILETNKLVDAAQGSPNVGWDGRVLVDGMRRARRRYLSFDKSLPVAQQVLPSLNPHTMERSNLFGVSPETQGRSSGPGRPTRVRHS